MKKSLVLVLAAFAAFSMNCLYSYAVKHPTSILVTTGSNVGQYTSQGTITIHESSLGSATFGLSVYAAGPEGVAARTPETDELAKELNDKLVAKAKELGSNAVINVRYGYSKFPILIPFLGPIAITHFGVTGEAVTIGGTPKK
ncbi:hypothetical protein [Leptospira sarikeiensis]|uniref:Uncharacterized protein n=1 Tax=Leptospira sarikeiensis TaxID=2484943 RepID=A0A4V3JSH0_9LEPT|nr:hypothetical protein [Leptospira sarikeiensis]TGL64130.1 hypothetical protein EHQ64_03835 [Leptospira sarikeiensis]